MSALGDLLARVARAEGSTRPVALVRIGLPIILWARFGSDLALYSKVPMAIGLLFFTSTLAMLLGVASRLSTAAVVATLLLLVGYLGVHKGELNYLHHHVSLLLLCTALLALTPCGRSYSVDRWLALRAAERAGLPAPPERGALWAQWLICLQLSAVYFWGAVDKSYPAYLDGERVQQFILYFHLGSDLPDSPLFPPLCCALAIGSVAFEYLLAVGLWVRRWQRWLMPLGLLFHAVIYYTMPVVTFTATVWLLYLLFLPPDAVHRAIDRVSR